MRLLKDAAENYPAWLDAIGRARRFVHFESYIISDDATGAEFADALITRARDGVRVRVIYDWLGAVGKASRRYWARLRAGGVDVRCYNPPRWDSPFGWLSRDHRKSIVVDGEVGFITGLCVGQGWVGNPERRLEPFRDTGVEVRGPAVAEIEQAFADAWAMIGNPIPADEITSRETIAAAGPMAVRVVASVPTTAGLFRVDQLVAALARKRLWLTDAYFGGMTSYVQALRAAALDGVDVRLLLPGASDIPLLTPLSRAGYRSLLQAGVRIFEWKGTMLHAKTAVADGHWARVGSTNLNIASWFGNCELDLVVENESFAGEMEAMYLRDLDYATEVVLNERQKVRAPRRSSSSPSRRGKGSDMGRAAAGVLRLGHTVGAAFTNRRTLEPIEARIAGAAGLLLLVLGLLVAPRF